MPLEDFFSLFEYSEMQESEGSTEDQNQSAQPQTMEEQESEHEPPESSKLRALYESLPSHDQGAPRLLRSHINEEEDSHEYTRKVDEWRKVHKTIMVGSDFQAIIPEGLCNYDDALPYENEDKLLWDPNPLENIITDDFLKKAAAMAKPTIPLGTQIRDDEQALYLLQQCGHNVKEALRRIKINIIPAPDSMSLWSEEECENFESGVRCYGKNFHMIQQTKVRTRSVGELVQFYYFWKKSERHDMFANKTRLEKKKYTLHPGLTDFMDRFVEDQDGRDRSSSPNVQFSIMDGKKLSIDNLQQNQKPPPEI